MAYKIKSKKLILKTDKDFADYGKLRSLGKSPDEALEIITLSKKIKKIS